MEQVSNVLFQVSNGLLVPVIAGLLYFFIRSLFMLGGFFNQYMRRMKQDRELKTRIDKLDHTNIEELEKELDDYPDNLFTRTIKRVIPAPGKSYINRILSEYEVAADADLGKYKVLTKFGPILGLMGTLIPMGPALAGLSTGDVASMAYNMQVAFATTVIGLFAGAVGFVLLQVKQRWFVSDLYSLEFIADISAEKQKNAIKPHAHRLSNLEIAVP